MLKLPYNCMIVYKYRYKSQLLLLHLWLGNGHTAVLIMNVANVKIVHDMTNLVHYNVKKHIIISINECVCTTYCIYDVYTAGIYG